MDRWVRLMAYEGGSGLWYHNEESMAVMGLPVSDSLRWRIRHWHDRYDFEFNDPKNLMTFDYLGFGDEGDTIAFAIKQELPDWTVIYYNTGLAVMLFFISDDVDRRFYEYEITLPRTCVDQPPIRL